ncbi:U-box domain-containing protein 33-like [Castanea sativa]|uniref:U-box domain-containing protein 33-like n=1 Tax=Castanea sativa TaxID=21020 RepID=UPI003F64B5A2
MPASSQIGFHHFGAPMVEAYGQEIIELPVAPRISEEIIYVAVGDIVKESILTIAWALQKSKGKKICLLHVLQPSQTIPLLGTRFPASSLEEEQVKAHRKTEMKNMLKTLNRYLLICRQIGVQVGVVHTAMESIEKGIVDLIAKHGIKKLVMGAAADKNYSRKLKDLKSKKAKYVRQEAPASCHIQFICKGNLIRTREGSLLNGADVKAESLLPEERTPNASDYIQGSVTDGDVSVALIDELDEGRCADECNGSLRIRSPLTRSSTVGVSPLSLQPKPNIITDKSISGAHGTVDGDIYRTLYNQLQQVMAEAESAKREAFQATLKCRQAERDANEAIRKVKESESLYAEDLKCKKEMEKVLAKQRAELEKVKHVRDQVMRELKISQNQRSLFESQVKESHQSVKGLEMRIMSVLELSQIYKRERDEMQMERDTALKEVEELRRMQGVVASCTCMPQFFSEFTFSEIKEATRNFDPSLIIGQGGYGNIFKCFLRCTQVAIKVLLPGSSQGPSEFHQEVNVLSKLKHPNLVKLIGSCPEVHALIYELLPNGSLEDRLNCKNNTPPLSWQTRIRLATELCSVLVFLHSHNTVHADLKPSNILLDASFIGKLSDFGICRILRDSSSDTTLCHRTIQKGTLAYMDPEFIHTGVLTIKSDVYSFGIILLQLLTGRSAFGIKKEVEYAISTGNFKALLDPLAGDWPFVLAEQLGRLALKCCDMYGKCRPDLGTEVWRVLQIQTMRATSCGGSSSISSSSISLDS